MKSKFFNIFRNGSKTYFFSSLFFTGQTRDDVFTLYSFVRKADDFVDAIPQQGDAFYQFRADYHRAASGGTTTDEVVDAFVELMHRKRIAPEWVDAFFRSMEADLTQSTYDTLEELHGYLYGSAEVVGLMMAMILDLRPASHPAARLLGRAMQYINFIRDIPEDLALGRYYLPRTDMARFGLDSLEYGYVLTKPVAFEEFIDAQVQRYRGWQAEAERGFRFIPRRYLIPIKTASDMYKWTAERIADNPYIVYRRKVKPSIPKILTAVTQNAIQL